MIIVMMLFLFHSSPVSCTCPKLQSNSNPFNSGAQQTSGVRHFPFRQLLSFPSSPWSMFHLSSPSFIPPRCTVTCIFTLDSVFNPSHSFYCTSLYKEVHLFPSVASVMASSERTPQLLMVSNKTTAIIKRSSEGSYSFTQGSGGLISGVSGLSQTIPYTWYGWPGIEVPEAETAALSRRLRDDFGSVPIFLDDELADRHYNGFASNVPMAFDL